MRKLLSILILCVFAATWIVADDYVDDIYYSDAAEAERQIETGALLPVYDKAKMQPLYFEEQADSASQAVADTIRLQPEVTQKAQPML